MPRPYSPSYLFVAVELLFCYIPFCSDQTPCFVLFIKPSLSRSWCIPSSGYQAAMHVPPFRFGALLPLQCAGALQSAMDEVGHAFRDCPLWLFLSLSFWRVAVWWQVNTDTPSLCLMPMNLWPSHLMPAQTEPKHDTAAFSFEIVYNISPRLSPSTPVGNGCCSGNKPPKSSPPSSPKHNTRQSVLQVSTTVSEMAHARVTLLHRVLHVPYLSPLRDLELVRTLQPLVQNIS